MKKRSFKFQSIQSLTNKTCIKYNTIRNGLDIFGCSNGVFQHLHTDTMKLNFSNERLQKQKI